MLRIAGNSLRRAAIPLCGLLLLAANSCGGGDGGGGPLTNLYCFGSSSTDARSPDGGLLQASDGNFYGTTYNGGIDGGVGPQGGFTGNGTVFKITPAGAETVLHLFGADPGDGIGPTSLIQGSDGNLYGMTAYGGANGSGLVFRLTLDGAETVYSIGAPGLGRGLIQGSDGNFYGTTDSVLFKLTPDGVVTILYYFGGYPGDAISPSGAPLQGRDGNFYGLTSAVAASTAFGAVYQVTPQGGEQVLHAFTGSPADGATPNGALIQDSHGILYGTTYAGGANTGVDYLGSGTVFKITTEKAYTILYSFSGMADGSGPAAGLVQGNDGNFYGTTSLAGSADGGGTMFQITPAGVFTVLYTFPSSGARGPATPLVQGKDGNLYGTTSEGGPNASGCFFRFALN